MHPEIPAACFARARLLALVKETLRVVLFVAPRGSDELLQRSSTLCPTSFRPGSRRQNETSKRSFLTARADGNLWRALRVG